MDVAHARAIRQAFEEETRRRRAHSKPASHATTKQGKQGDNGQWLGDVPKSET